MRTFASCGELTKDGLLWIVICGLALPAAFGQNANQWYGWAQCSVNVQGPVIDGNGTILGQYYHQETQTWQLTGAAPTGTTYPANWNVNGSGWETVGSGRTWTLSSPAFPAPLQVLQRASDTHWLINAGAHSQITGYWAALTPTMASPESAELVFPPVSDVPQSTTIYGSSTVTDTAGKYGILQPGGPTSQISCSWKFAKGVVPPPPIRQVVVPGSGSQLKPSNAPAGSVFVPITPCRVADTRTVRQPGSRGFAGILSGIHPGLPATFQIAGAGNACGIPALGPTALSLNVTAVPNGPLTSMSIRPIGQAEPAQPLLSATDGLPTANAVILPFGSGAVEVSVTNWSNVVIDVNGYFMPVNITPQGSAFYPLTPCRALNTMSPSNPLAATVARDVDVRTACRIPTSATAVVMDVTVAPQGFLGSLTVWASGHAQPATSNINAYDGQVKSNMVIAQTGTNGQVSFFASDATNVVADVVGYFGTPGAPGALTFHPIAACTGVNTQWADGTYGGPALDAYSTRDFPINQADVCGVPGWARAYSLNFIATPTVVLTGLNIQPSGFGNVPSWSLYAADGQVTASAGLLTAGTGGLTVTPFSPTHLMMIFSGYFD
jgi:hypothetical protein